MNINFLTPGTIYTFKLNSGEELVAKVVTPGQTNIENEHPVSIAPGPQGMGLVPSLFTGNMSKNIQLNINSVALVAETDEAVAAKYIEATTGIKVPDKKIIMG
jgi:hypothetical protein